jgi:hypothetical protein
MRLLMLMIAMAVQTGSSITVEFLGTIRILVASFLNYRNELSGTNFAGVSSEDSIDTRTKTDIDKGNKSPHPPHANKGCNTLIVPVRRSVFVNGVCCS